MNAERVTYRTRRDRPRPRDHQDAVAGRHGGIVGVLGIARDVTESRRTAERTARRPPPSSGVALGAAELGTWRTDVWRRADSGSTSGPAAALRAWTAPRWTSTTSSSVVHPGRPRGCRGGYRRTESLTLRGAGGSMTIACWAAEGRRSSAGCRVRGGFVRRGRRGGRRAVLVVRDHAGHHRDGRHVEARLREQEALIREAGARSRTSAAGSST